jgi:hypothetical protein
MELRESADGLRWAIGRAGAMAVIWVQIAKTASPNCGEPEPDLDLIAGGRGDNVRFGRADVALRRDSRAWGSRRGRNLCISVLAISALAVIWLQKTAKTAGEAEVDLLTKGESGNAAGPNRRFNEPGHMGCRAVALRNSVRLIHNRGNSACCPDFKGSHYQLPLFN